MSRVEAWIAYYREAEQAYELASDRQMGIEKGRVSR
jgi:hypothetical protein